MNDRALLFIPLVSISGANAFVSSEKLKLSVTQRKPFADVLIQTGETIASSWLFAISAMRFIHHIKKDF